jgi:hypothetical protein
MGGVSSRGGSWEMVKPRATTRFKMEDVCIIICNMIKKIDKKK